MAPPWPRPGVNCQADFTTRMASRIFLSSIFSARILRCELYFQKLCGRNVFFGFKVLIGLTPTRLFSSWKGRHRSGISTWRVISHFNKPRAGKNTINCRSVWCWWCTKIKNLTRSNFHLWVMPRTIHCILRAFHGPDPGPALPVAIGTAHDEKTWKDRIATKHLAFQSFSKSSFFSSKLLSQKPNQSPSYEELLNDCGFWWTWGLCFEDT